MTDTANAPERIWAYADYSDWDETGGWVDHENGMPDVGPLTEYVLATHRDELVAAAYLDAAQVASTGKQSRRESIAFDIEERIPDNARAALTAYGERMKAEAAREAQAKIARLTMIANELSWSKKTRDISNRLFAALQENKNV